MVTKDHHIINYEESVLGRSSKGLFTKGEILKRNKRLDWYKEFLLLFRSFLRSGQNCRRHKDDLNLLTGSEQQTIERRCWKRLEPIYNFSGLLGTLYSWGPEMRVSKTVYHWPKLTPTDFNRGPLRFVVCSNSWIW